MWTPGVFDPPGHCPLTCEKKSEKKLSKKYHKKNPHVRKKELKRVKKRPKKTSKWIEKRNDWDCCGRIGTNRTGVRLLRAWIQILFMAWVQFLTQKKQKNLKIGHVNGILLTKEHACIDFDHGVSTVSYARKQKNWKLAMSTRNCWPRNTQHDMRKHIVEFEMCENTRFRKTKMVRTNWKKKHPGFTAT